VLIYADAGIEGLCRGTEWQIDNWEGLVESIARLLVGRTDHARRILEGEVPGPPRVRRSLLRELKKRLSVPPGKDPWQRDGLLFELIAWSFVKISCPGDACAVVDPHLKSTFQGTDGIRIRIIREGGDHIEADIYENKCTERAQDIFSSEVLKSFRHYIDGGYDDEIMQKTLALMEQLDLPAEDLDHLIDGFELARPYFLHACLTTEGGKPAWRHLFRRYEEIATGIERKHAHTFDLENIRRWFEHLAGAVMAAIEGWVEDV
jgi:hypothetical protein